MWGIRWGQLAREEWEVPGKAKPAGTHRGGGATTRRRGRLGTVAREAAGRVEKARGRGDEKIERRYPCKGCGGEATKGGPAVRMPHGAERAWALAPTAARPRRGSVTRRGAPGVADAWTPVGSRRGREERGVGGAWAILEEKGLGRARRNSNV
jgi:hypothetical protein